ncbi:hypothetical protein N7501_009635 [Penicillium viridicatum]|nr:hypothetical protein N7501_009635 [Penicillium viridicatum]
MKKRHTKQNQETSHRCGFASTEPWKVRPPPYLKSSTSTLCISRFATTLLQQTTYPAHSATPLTYHQTANMKPVVSALNAWSCVVISAFAIIILSVLGSLYNSNNHAYTGSKEEPEDGPAVAASIYTAVIVYAGFFVFCGFQAYLHMRDSRGGAISLH